MDGITKLILLVWGSFCCGKVVDWLWVHNHLNFNETMLVGFVICVFILLLFFILDEL